MSLKQTMAALCLSNSTGKHNFDNQDDGSLYEFVIRSSTSKTTENYAWDLEPGTYYLLAKYYISSIRFTRVQKLNICYKLVSPADFLPSTPAVKACNWMPKK